MSSKVIVKPGFALESVDVYETSDLPEADQHMFGQGDDTTDSIETLHISANEAFGRLVVDVGKDVMLKSLHQI